MLFPTLYPTDHGAGSAADIADSVLRGRSDLAESRSGGAGDAGQALLRLGDGVLCGVFCGFCAL